MPALIAVATSGKSVVARRTLIVTGRNDVYTSANANCTRAIVNYTHAIGICTDAIGNYIGAISICTHVIANVMHANANFTRHNVNCTPHKDVYMPAKPLVMRVNDVYAHDKRLHRRRKKVVYLAIWKAEAPRKFSRT